MPQPEKLPELRELAESFLKTMREAARASVMPTTTDSERVRANILGDVTTSAARFALASAASPDLAQAISESPGLAALSLVSRDLADIAARNPALAELAVNSPNLARVAEKAPEMAELALASPELASMIEMTLSRSKK